MSIRYPIRKSTSSPKRTANRSMTRASSARCTTSMFIAAARVAELGESPATVDFVATEGIKLPQPPLKEIDGVGAATVLDELARTNRNSGSDPLASPKLLTAMSAESQTFYRTASRILGFRLTLNGRQPMRAIDVHVHPSTRGLDTSRLRLFRRNLERNSANAGNLRRVIC